jgi:hypothetical protein
VWLVARGDSRRTEARGFLEFEEVGSEWDGCPSPNLIDLQPSNRASDVLTAHRIETMDGGPMDGPASAEERSERVYTVEARPGVRFEVVVGTEATDPLSIAYARAEYQDDYNRLLAIVSRAIGPRDRVLDLGGHIGSFALGAAASLSFVLNFVTSQHKL